MDEDREMRDRILLALLPHVIFDGWTGKSLAAGLADAGLPEEAGRGAFPGGMLEIARHFSAYADRRMLEAFAARDVETLGQRERLLLAVRLRLEALAPHREAVRRALAHLALPPHTAEAMRATWRTVDMLWQAAGDRSADYTYYTRRAVLTPVYATTVLYWLADESPDFEDSWSYLERRLDDAIRLPRLFGGGLFRKVRRRRKEG